LIVSFTTPILVHWMHSAAFVVISIIIMGGILARSISIAYMVWHGMAWEGRTQYMLA
jgi:hypothetical protein